MKREYPSYSDVQKWMFEVGFEGIPDPDKKAVFVDPSYLKLTAKVVDWVHLVQKANPQTDLDWEILHRYPDAIETILNAMEEDELSHHRVTISKPVMCTMGDSPLPHQHDRDDKFLYLCKVEITVPVVGSSAEDALSNLESDLSDIVYDLGKEVPQAVKTEVLDRVHHLTSDSIWRDYHPHGDYYGPQESCAYYTVEEYEKRKVAEGERKARVQALVEGLTGEEMELLKRELFS